MLRTVMQKELRKGGGLGGKDVMLIATTLSRCVGTYVPDLYRCATVGLVCPPTIMLLHIYICFSEKDRVFIQTEPLKDPAVPYPLSYLADPDAAAP